MRMMSRAFLKWLRLPLLVMLYPLSSIAEDKGPMPPPEGPFFSSKPLLYFGEEPENRSNVPEPPPVVAPAQQYPGYYGPAPYGAGRGMGMFPQMPAYPQTWGGQYPYYQYNPNSAGYPQFPNGRGY